MIDIVETKPAEIIEIFNADINVDFDKALDYEEPKPEPQLFCQNQKIPGKRYIIKSLTTKLTILMIWKDFQSGS